MRNFPLYVLWGALLFAGNAYADYKYTEDSARIVNGVLYDVNGEAVTGVYEEFYENNIKKSEMPYVDGVLNGVGTLYDEEGNKIANMPFVNGKLDGIRVGL